MLIAERRSLIIQELRENKKVVVSELSRKFDVSEETIRRDLDRLAEEGVAVKGYGGAVLKEQLGMELPFNVRYKMNPEEKVFTNQAITSYHMTRKGIGISLMFDRTLEKMPEENMPVFYRLKDAEMRGEMSIVHNEESQMSLAAKEFLGFLKKSLIPDEINKKSGTG